MKLYVKATQILGIIILSIGFLTGTNLGAQTNSFYVSSQSGNDGWSGQLPSPNSANSDGPFRSLGKAQSAMERSSVKTVQVRSGTYGLSSNWQLTSADSGQTWQNYPGENPVIDGNGQSGRVLLSSTSNLKFSGLTFQNLAGNEFNGGTGGILGSDWSNVTFDNNTFNNCLNSCIYAYAPNGTSVVNNRFNNAGPAIGPFGDTWAIEFGNGPTNSNISHNSFQNLQGGAVLLAYGNGASPFNNVIDRNYINNATAGPFSDGIGDIATIFVTDRYHRGNGTAITNNVILNNCGGGFASIQCKAIYLDDEISNVTITGNICSACGSVAVQIHGGDHVTLQNNIFDVSNGLGSGVIFYQQAYQETDYGMASNTFTGNIVYTSGSASGITMWQNQKTGGDANPAVWNNLYYAAGGGAWQNPSQGVNDSSPVYANPQFASPSSGNYSMASSSPAFSSIGFQPMATDVRTCRSIIGVRTAAAGTTAACAICAIAAQFLRSSDCEWRLHDSEQRKQSGLG